MHYNFRLFWRMAYRSFFKHQGTHGAINRKRLYFLLLFYTLWPFWTVVTRLCFLLDDILWPAHKNQPIEKPLFLLGNFRSGSSFLHRVLAKDKSNFTTLRTWDIFMTPSITQKKVARLVKQIDARFGGPLLRSFKRFDRWSLGTVRIHPISFFSPEEDESLLLFNFSTLFVSFLFPFLDEMPPYAFFDDAIPEKERRKIMGFYRSCVQRHLYDQGGSLHFLSKNPSFSAKIVTLTEFFPDARIIYLVRNPVDMLPSTISWLSFVWHVVGRPLERYPYRDWILQFTQYWYRHPLQYLEQRPSRQNLILRYEDLFNDPADAIMRFYRQFGYQISPSANQVFANAVEQNHTYQSDHEYALEEMGFTRDQVLKIYLDIFERFGYTHCCTPHSPEHTFSRTNKQAFDPFSELTTKETGR